jgi:hypothetical protein
VVEVRYNRLTNTVRPMVDVCSIAAFWRVRAPKFVGLFDVVNLEGLS